MLKLHAGVSKKVGLPGRRRSLRPAPARPSAAHGSRPTAPTRTRPTVPSSMTPPARWPPSLPSLGIRIRARSIIRPNRFVMLRRSRPIPETRMAGLTANSSTRMKSESGLAGRVPWTGRRIAPPQSDGRSVTDESALSTLAVVLRWLGPRAARYHGPYGGCPITFEESPHGVSRFNPL